MKTFLQALAITAMTFTASQAAFGHEDCNKPKAIVCQGGAYTVKVTKKWDDYYVKLKKYGRTIKSGYATKEVKNTGSTKLVIFAAGSPRRGGLNLRIATTGRAAGTAHVTFKDSSGFSNKLLECWKQGHDDQDDNDDGYDDGYDAGDFDIPVYDRDEA